MRQRRTGQQNNLGGRVWYALPRPVRLSTNGAEKELPDLTELRSGLSCGHRSPRARHAPPSWYSEESELRTSCLGSSPGLRFTGHRPSVFAATVLYAQQGPGRACGDISFSSTVVHLRLASGDILASVQFRPPSPALLLLELASKPSSGPLFLPRSHQPIRSTIDFANWRWSELHTGT